ncbi:general secretory pathway protein N [Sulfuricella sp. T08]|uniref:type II secretion system protein N n=1 Tax=Sulfuricella sp. T08 TaxID=1632857 RepID=UPI0006179826|nr:type II secretion system protein N [Sulfuricella sp. T08]GAO34652.1 general secretory pathway protein N [Sulfuricella sp. T08]
MRSEATVLPRHRRLLYALAGVGLYVVSLIATAPASMMDWMLLRLTNNRIILVQPEGGLWYGKARNLMLKTADGGLRSMGSVNWEILLLPLLKLELAARLEVADGQSNSSGIIAAGFGKLHLRQMRATLPVSLLSEFMPTWQTWKPNGALKISTDEFTLSQQGVRGTAELEWRNASLGLSQVNPLGDYRVNIQGDQKIAQISVSTISGVLHLVGKGGWSESDGLSFRGTALADPSKRAELRDFLRLLGSEQSNGVYQIVISHFKLRK